ncbi:MAG TPA: universal stress protein [Ktedonobacteraceae bacterium]|nr:universal stress protein [Ktedonobacteraceae bacterium]
MYQNILVPLDGSRRAEEAVAVAARLARASGSTIFLLRVVSMSNQFASYTALEPLVTQQAIDSQLEEAKNYLDRLAKEESLANIQTRTLVFFGQPAVNILSAAESYGMDLIILSSHGYTGMTRWIMGSVAEKVSHASPVPVLILREGKPPLAGLHPDGSGSLKALVPLDGSAHAEAAIAPAAQLIAGLAAPGRGALHLTQVVVMPALEQLSYSERAMILQKAKENLSATVQEIRKGLIANYGDDLHLSITWSVTVDDDIAGGIVRMAENGEDAEGAGTFGRCDMIAMATHGYSGLQRWTLGSITERVLHTTRLPLLIVRPTRLAPKEQSTSGSSPMARVSD